MGTRKVLSRCESRHAAAQRSDMCAVTRVCDKHTLMRQEHDTEAATERAAPTPSARPPDPATSQSREGTPKENMFTKRQPPDEQQQCVIFSDEEVRCADVLRHAARCYVAICAQRRFAAFA
jgi:hypothetical protein